MKSLLLMGDRGIERELYSQKGLLLLDKMVVN